MPTLDTPPTDQVTVEAETVEDALSEISAQFGENAEIMRAQKVHRGGVGGFFAKEVVQLTARRRRDRAPSLRPEHRSLPSQRPESSGIGDVLERMAQDADAEDSDFRTVLKRELGSGSESTAAAGFLTAVGWEDADAASEEDESAPVETDAEPETGSPEDLVVPPFADAEVVPDPVPVGPVLRPVLTPVEFPDVDEALMVVEDADIIEAVANPVVPLHDPSGTDFDEAAIDDEPVPVAEIPVPTLIGTDKLVAVPPAEDPDWWRTAQPDDAPRGMGSVSWGTTALLRLGLPGPVIDAVAGLDGNDDLGWIDGIAAVVAPHCGPLPQDDLIIVGPHAERLAEPLGLPLVRSGDMAPYDGSFCAMVEDSFEDRQWLEFVRGGRGIHLVVGDEPWQDLLIDEPVAVSWVGETAVADALYLAFTLGATLGFGTVDGFVSSMVRAQPTDVALAVRRIVGRQ
ncbi:MAG: hypothetical protein GY722_20620 [bacterium]|nr:hypothetical protein [bacterium]